MVSLEEEGDGNGEEPSGEKEGSGDVDPAPKEDGEEDSAPKVESEVEKDSKDGSGGSPEKESSENKDEHLIQNKLENEREWELTMFSILVFFVIVGISIYKDTRKKKTAHK